MEGAACVDGAVDELLLGERAATASLLAAAGFGWDDVGFDAYWPVFDAMMDALGSFPKATLHTMVKLGIFLASPDGALDPAEVLAWLPSPAELGELSARSVRASASRSGFVHSRNQFSERITPPPHRNCARKRRSFSKLSRRSPMP